MEEFILRKPEFAVPITMACSLFTCRKINQPNGQAEERHVVPDAYLISAIWQLLGTRIRTGEETMAIKWH